MNDRDFQIPLFKEELAVLEAATQKLDTNTEPQELYTDFQRLVSNYEKLLKFTRKIFKISDSQAKNLLQRENEIKNILDNAGQGFLTFSKDLVVDREYSAECLRIFGKDIGRCNIVELLSGEDQQQNKEIEDTFRRIFETRDPRLQQQNISTIPSVIKLGQKDLALKIKLISDWGNSTQLIMLIITDVTEKYQAEKKIEFLSQHDKLTSLYNRDYIDNWITQCNPDHHFPISVIFADINGLKLANDIFGHLQGDQLLISFSHVLSVSTRASDIVARWGGDEFLILLPRTDVHACETICKRIEGNCKDIKGAPIELSSALGCATQKRPHNSIIDLFGIAENMMYNNKLLQSNRIRRQLIMSVEKTFHSRFFEDSGHIKRVEAAAVSFGEILGLKKHSAVMQHLKLLAKIHDIGKITLPKDILGKEESLTHDEWEIIKSHSNIGFRMAQSIGETVVAEAIYAMHERWDGTGYPRQLIKEEIPFLARMFQIVDVFDVMTHDRPYQKAKTKEEAIQELNAHKSSQFDPELVDTFVNSLDSIIRQN